MSVTVDGSALAALSLTSPDGGEIRVAFAHSANWLTETHKVTAAPVRLHAMQEVFLNLNADPGFPFAYERRHDDTEKLNVP